MWEFIFSSLWGWIGTAGVIVAICVAVGYFIPQFRLYALAVAGVAVTMASTYAKGSRDRAALEKKRRDEAVAEVQGRYDEIERRKDTPADLEKRLKDGTF